ncbi:MAG: glycosyltransferase, partial [Thermoplasmata archaeon]
MKIAALIWTYNPSINSLSKVVKSVTKQVDLIIMVDNGSKNFEEIKEKIKKITSKVFFIQIGYNSGVHAIKVGINYALLRGVKYILILDQDTIVTSKKAVPMALDLFKKFSKDVAVVHLESENKPYLFKESDHYIIFSGSIIRAYIFKFHPSIKLREEFF